ncbi:MAG TPA: DNA-directed RNA polymerase subunit omega [Spirochaetia bacterium]|nr:DNA-directed RNA polymerase subunit omega [Spirochaetales bacterium]HRS65471.1 DNA-directed RNA polymerase subunit omega [Spirochaetia bacterium]HPD80185.1 DNA-directed RNA polymerase subunit omega [Spirochaetales bacterium]HQG40150.1 DNA-directed RNA polymerase subunit omega [Spirochaetales bacterium]HQK34924.1 DNA-directed RNA polymerase subunit omega [Spirochaetales bacterium]
MGIPLNSLLDYNGNAYELAVAISKRAYQLAVLKTPDVVDSDGKVVGLAMNQIFSKEIVYQIEE